MFIWRANDIGGAAEYNGQPIFTLTADNLVFLNMVLRPGGEPILNGIFRWRENSLGEPIHIDAYEVVKAQPDVLQFAFRTRSRVNPSLDNSTGITVTYDEAEDRFVYRVAIALHVTAEGYQGLFPRAVEFFNIYPLAVTNYQHVIYESEESAYLVPINQYIHAHSQKKPVKALGRLAFINQPAGNPTIRMLPATNVPVIVNRCHLMHDEHILGVLGNPADTTFTRKFDSARQPYEYFPRIPAGLQARVEFDFYDSYGRESDAMIAVCRQQRLPKKDLARLLPSRQLDSGGYDSFETPHRMDATDHGNFWVPVSGWEKSFTDWFWATPPRPVLERRCIWERKYGRTGVACLKVVTETDMRAGWESLYMPIIIQPRRRYVLAIHVRTENLAGKGAFLGYYFGPDESAKRAGKPFALHASPVGLTGTQDWTKIQLAFPLPDKDAELFIRFWHEGQGTSWWDDISLVGLDDERIT